jgi:hypothetical protein
LTKLQEIKHNYDTNKNENGMKLVTLTQPKTSFLCGSILAKACTYLALSHNSVITKEYFISLYGKLGICITGTMLFYYKERDMSCNNNKIYHECFDIKIQKQHRNQYHCKKNGTRYLTKYILGWIMDQVLWN